MDEQFKQLQELQRQRADLDAQIVALADELGYVPLLVRRGEMQASGYSRGSMDAMDREVATEYPCQFCGGQCNGEGYWCGGSYRAVAYCTKCHASWEF